MPLSAVTSQYDFITDGGAKNQPRSFGAVLHCAAPPFPRRRRSAKKGGRGSRPRNGGGAHIVCVAADAEQTGKYATKSISLAPEVILAVATSTVGPLTKTVSETYTVKLQTA